MMENNKGHIVSIASLAGHCGVSKLVDYCASKFAAVGFDEALRMELEVIVLCSTMRYKRDTQAGIHSQI